jgi:hypothetical protein
LEPPLQTTVPGPRRLRGQAEDGCVRRFIPSTASSAGRFDGEYFDAVVIDRGTPGTAGPDRIAVEIGVVLIPCSNLAQSHHPLDVTNGNLDVH